MQNSVFNDYSRYYNLLYKQKDYLGEAQYVVDLLKRYGLTKGEILEFGSGTGRHGRLIAEKGFDVHGIELSEKMIALSYETSGFTNEIGDIGAIRLNRQFNAVISLFHVFSYQITNEAVANFFRSAAVHLDVDGLLIFDFWHSPAVFNQVPELRLKRIKSEDVNIWRISEPEMNFEGNTVDVKFDIFIQDIDSKQLSHIEEKHVMRHFSASELIQIASGFGFDFLCLEEFGTGSRVDMSTWGPCIVFRKTSNV